MELTRRDALAALVAAGVAGGALAVADSKSGEDSTPEGTLSQDEVTTLASLAEVVYPSEIEGIESFVATYVGGRVADREAYAEGVREALSHLDAYAESWQDAEFADLDRATREAVLRSMDADAADPDPGGSDVEHVRYYAVNELLFALYASPTGGKLVGIENPQGHPGGIGSYQRGPDATADDPR